MPPSCATACSPGTPRSARCSARSRRRPTPTLVVRKEDAGSPRPCPRTADAFRPRSASRSSGGAGDVWPGPPADDQPAVVVGIPLPAVGAEFYEIVSTDRAARDPRHAGHGAAPAFALLTTLGRGRPRAVRARRVMAPLDDVAVRPRRASRPAGCSTRLPSTDDPDLATIVGSFNSMVEALDERIQRDARFAADLSHELRSPLTTLVTSVQVIERRRDEMPPRTAAGARPRRRRARPVPAPAPGPARARPPRRGRADAGAHRRRRSPSWSASRSSRATAPPPC